MLDALGPGHHRNSGGFVASVHGHWNAVPVRFFDSSDQLLGRHPAAEELDELCAVRDVVGDCSADSFGPLAGADQPVRVAVGRDRPTAGNDPRPDEDAIIEGLLPGHVHEVPLTGDPERREAALERVHRVAAGADRRPQQRFVRQQALRIGMQVAHMGVVVPQARQDVGAAEVDDPGVITRIRRRRRRRVNRRDPVALDDHRGVLGRRRAGGVDDRRVGEDGGLGGYGYRGEQPEDHRAAKRGGNPEGLRSAPDAGEGAGP